MVKKTYEMVLEYPKIFDLSSVVDGEGKTLEGKPGDLDRGDANSSLTWLRALSKNPVAVVNAYFTSEVDLQDLMECEDFENKVTNPKTGEESNRIKDGDEELGIGKYIQLKRKFNDIIEYKDRKTGEFKEIDKGGAPSVKILDTSVEPPVFKEYDYQELGSPSNGTVSKVRFEAYKGNLRLEAFGITELVEFVDNTSDDPMEDF